MPLNGGEEVRVLDQPFGYQWYNWALASGGIYFVNVAGPEKQGIEFFDFATRKRTLIHVMDKSEGIGLALAPEGIGLALAPDGKSLLYAQPGSEDCQIMLVKNFH